MIDKVRCKLLCTYKKPYEYIDSEGVKREGASISLKAVHGITHDANGGVASYEQSCEENKIFGKLTPSASFDTNIHNPSAAAMFVVGSEYYVDFTLAPTVEDYDEQRRAAAKAKAAEAAGDAEPA